MCCISNREPRSGPCCFVRWMPLFMIIVLLTWAYHVFIVQICVNRVENCVEVAFLLITFHVLLIMFFWSWGKCIITGPARIPSQWKIPDEDVARLMRIESTEEKSRIMSQIAKSLPVKMCTKTGTVRYCDICRIIKPDRAHHCSSCGQCVLKRDHHCPWVNNCIHFHNTKFFIVFLIYADMFLFYLLFVMLYYLLYLEGFDFDIVGYSPTKLWLMVQHVVIISFSLCVWIMTMVTLSHFVKNHTSVEAIYPPHFYEGGQNKNAYDLGIKQNFLEVFGSKWYLWFIPVYTTVGDGITFPMAQQDLKKVRVDGGRSDEGVTRIQIMKDNARKLLGLHGPNTDNA
ncbi:hypothetical protein KR074_001094 [Drosophila pseudoananassae]|nr:hypothetical protein KR074_001094 [Drosophila pseudoananassae]